MTHHNPLTDASELGTPCAICGLPVAPEYDPEDGTTSSPWAHIACHMPTASGRYAVATIDATRTEAEATTARYTHPVGARLHANHLATWNTPYNGRRFNVYDLERGCVIYTSPTAATLAAELEAERLDAQR